VVDQPLEPDPTQTDLPETESPAQPEPQAPPRRRLGQTSGPAQYLGTGKRKTSVARVILRPGDGATWFNGRSIEDYFPRLAHRVAALAPLKTAGVEGTYDIRVRVHGGGPTGQAGAVRHGIARALVDADPNLRVPLKREGYLTRDAREVERKKAGLHKARKAPQFSKR
jgi:small subunit ribosomal protein S9